MRFMSFFASLILFLLCLFSLPLFHSNFTYAQFCSYCSNPFNGGASSCNACYQSVSPVEGGHILAQCHDFEYSNCNGTQEQYWYTKYVVRINWGTSGTNKVCSEPYRWVINNVVFFAPYTTDVQNNNLCYQTYGGIPPGCNQGEPDPQNCPQTTLSPDPSVTGNPNPGGDVGEGPNCPAIYVGDDCDTIPCGYRADCLCDELCQSSCPPDCPTPTNTPTPTPYCTLSCPGKDGPVGGGSGSLGTGFGEPTPTPYQPPEAIGNIVYQGFNNFVCGLFKDGLNFNGACPDNQPGNNFTYQTRYNMLCGGSPYTYKAQVDSSAGGSGGLGGPTPTRGPSPTLGQYPPNCTLNPSQFPTPTGIPGDPGQGSTNGNFCSCSVTLGCQTQLYPVESSNCSSSCDAVFIPDNPVYNESVGIAITGTPNSISFDDGTTPAPNPGPSIAHTWPNAGVYRTTLTCGATTCQKKLNVYCSYIPKLWYKLRDASFHKLGGIQNAIPESIIPYDSDDTSDRELDIIQAGAVTSGGAINVGTGSLSQRGWGRQNYTASSRWNPTLYLDYIKSRKEYTTVTDTAPLGTISANEIAKDKINVVPPGNFIIDSASIQSNAPFVLVVQGDATITGDINPPEKSLAIIVTGKLKVEAAVDTISGIFVAQSTDLASDIPIGQTTPTTLKVNGNLISTTATDLTKRKADNIAQPSLFIAFKPEMYVDLVGLLSVRNYSYTELNP